MVDPPAISVAPPARVVSRNFRRVISVAESEDRSQRTITTIPLLFASVADLQRLRFLATTVLVPFKVVMVLVRYLDYGANRSLHPRHHLRFAGVGKGFCRVVVLPFQGHYPTAEVIN